jgi:hypothetical protein
MENKEIIIIGGGSSIREGLSLGLKEKIKDKYVLTLNFAFNHFDSTATVFVDDQFYRGYIYGCGITCNQEHIEKLKQLPLIIGAKRDYIRFYSNTIPLGYTFSYFHNIPLKKGFYVGKPLTGIFALHIAAYLLDYKGSIYCLGFDGGTIKGKDTHYYSDIKHRGIGKIDVYQEPPDHYFKEFLVEKNLNIYNVSPESKINSFRKITYLQMFEQLTSEIYDQDKLRQKIKEKLTCK